MGEEIRITIWPELKKVKFSIDPALPPGLTLDSLSGTIFGTPELSTDSVNYTITAWNAAGSAKVPLQLAVWPRSVACGAEGMVVHPDYTFFCRTPS